MSVALADWSRTWNELGVPRADAGLHQRLIAAWSEPHRRYHTLQHLRECLGLFEEAHDLAQRPGEVALALWFHDAIYDPRRQDNEERSAEWAHDSILAAGLDDETAKRLHSLVMATRHEEVPLDADAQLLVDIDLSSLGATAARFDESDLQIRDEYAHVPDEAYRQGRRLVLGEFLARPRLYTTPYFYEAFESRARDNLRRALARLSQEP